MDGVETEWHGTARCAHVGRHSGGNMSRISRRTFVAGSVGVAGSLALGACDPRQRPPLGRGSGGRGPRPLREALAEPGSRGLVDEHAYQQRVDDYLAHATTATNVHSPTGIALHLIAADRDPGYTWDIDSVTVDGLAALWEQIDTWQDTRDFGLMYLHWVHAYGRGGTPMTTIDPRVIDAIKMRMVANRYRYDDPRPGGRVDDLWFWSENHIIIGLVNEYLAGQEFPDDVFAVTGLTGREHLQRSRQPILDWIHERARFGFFEWHSNVYMLKNLTPLLTLAELGDDPEMVRAAGMALDLVLLDMAAHTHAGSYVAPRGRTYKKDKMTALDEDVFNSCKFLFDGTEYPYQSRTDNGATYLCAAKRYRPPQAIIEMATAPSPGVVRERHGIYVDGSAPVTANPVAPFGYDFDDPENMTFWWSLGAVGMWQIAGISLAEAEEHGLFDAPGLAQIKLLADLNGRDPDRIRAWEQANHDIVNFGFLSEANTYAWRGDAVSLASVVDHRFGEMRDQAHSWIAGIDAEALVFTTHPLTGIAETTDWGVDSEPGYWTGEASMPRCAQHERTAIHIYQPSWDESTDPLLWSLFNYRDYTHAYVPQDRFDEVAQSGHWTFVRKGSGYIALWSWRAPTWRAYDPVVNATDGMVQPFDLLATGGPDNVWIVEVGEGPPDDFNEWQASVVATEPTVNRAPEGFTVQWTSPSSGPLGFGSTAPFTVGGREQPLTDFPRHESSFGTVDRLATRYRLGSRRARLDLDFDRHRRRVTGRSR